MTSLLAFMKKEGTEQLRTGKMTILGLIFLLLGVMNPAVAKLTPWLLEVLAADLAQSGMTVTDVTVSALDAWVQFFKNAPIGLIAFVFLQSSIFTKEYTTGTLVLSLTKGLKRYKVVLAKSVLLAVLWSVGYWLCFGITYGYSAYFWDNAVAHHLGFAVMGWWVFGLFVITLMVLFSTLARSNTAVLCGVGGVVLVSYLVGLLPKWGRYAPTHLTDGTSLIYGATEVDAYLPALWIAAGIGLVCAIVSIPIFNKKQL